MSRPDQNTNKATPKAFKGLSRVWTFAAPKNAVDPHLSLRATLSHKERENNKWGCGSDRRFMPRCYHLVMKRLFVSLQVSALIRGSLPRPWGEGGRSDGGRGGRVRGSAASGGPDPWWSEVARYRVAFVSPINARFGSITDKALSNDLVCSRKVIDVHALVAQCGRLAGAKVLALVTNRRVPSQGYVTWTLHQNE